MPLLLTEVNKGRIALSKVADICSTNAARIFGFYPELGALRAGSIADITVLDMDCTWTIKRHALHSKCTATPFDGWRVKGKPTHVIVNGKVVYADGEVMGEPGGGRFVRAHRRRTSR